MEAATDQSVPDSTNGWWTTRRFSVVLALLIAAAFPDVLFGLKTFVFRDYLLFGYSVAHHYRESFWSGEIPLWNPLSQCGLPFLAQWNTMVLYPFSFIYLLLPLPWSLSFFCLAHLFLAGLGMYRLAWRWTGHGFASALAGVAFVFNGLTLSCLIYPNNIAGLGWLPWVVLLVERGWREGNRAAVLAALVAAVQMLSGAPEVFLFTGLLLLALWLGQFAVGSLNRVRMICRTALMAGLLACLVAAQALPFLQLLRYSQRDTAFEGNTWPLPGTGWANLLVPLFRCIQTSTGAYLQDGQAWISSTYLGAAMLTLALSAVWVVRRKSVWLLGSILAGSLVLALGDGAPLYTWLRKLFPQIMLVRYPVKFVILAACVVPLLAASGVAQFLRGDRTLRLPFRRTTVGLALLLCILIGGVLRFAFLYPGVRENWSSTFMSGATRAVFLWLILGLLFAIPAVTGSSRRIMVQLAVLLLAFLDGITNSPNQNPRVDPQAYTLRLPPLLEMNPAPEHGKSRSALTYWAMWNLHSTFVTNTFDGVLAFRLGLYSNANLIEGIPKVDGFFALNLGEEQKLRRQAFRGKVPVPQPLADFLAISQMSPQKPSLTWTNRPTAMPMVTAGQRPEFADPTHTFEAVLSPEFDPRHIVYLPLSVVSQVHLTNSAEITVAVKTAKAHQWLIDVNAVQPGLLVIAQTFYPAWTARIDGWKVPIWKANWTFQALKIPAGRHEVVLRYEDWVFRAGVIISGAGLGGCAVLFCWFGARTREQESRPSSPGTVR